MAAFWFIAGALSAFAALFALLPWLRSVPRLGPLPRVDWPVSVVVAALLVAGIGLYAWLGRPDLAANAGAASGAPPMAMGLPRGAPSAAVSAGAGSMSNAIASLQARLAKGSGSADDWELLAKAYEFMGQPEAAAQARTHQLPVAAPPTLATTASMPTPIATASNPQPTPASLKLLAQADTARRHKHLKEALAIYAKLAAADQLNADGWADYADTVASLHGNRLAGEPEQYIARALALDPRHSKALWLAASADEEAGRIAHAVGIWQQLQAVLPADSPDAKIVAANLQQDLRLVGGTGGASGPAASAAAPAAISTNVADASAVLQGRVSLSPALGSRLSGGETLFIIAKSVDSPGPPVAVLRGSAATWPVTFKLDDSQAMIAGRNLSSAARVTVEARVSRSGQALPMSGDLAGSSAVIDPRAHQPLAIVIDRVIP